MKLEQKLQLKQTLTPQLLLNLKLLVLPNLELETLIRTELEQNPALEILTEEIDESEKTSELAESEFEIKSFIEEAKEDVLRREEGFDIADFIADDTYLPSTAEESSANGFELSYSAKSNFEDTLLPTVKSLLKEEDFPIAEYIIGNISDDGFLTLPYEEISKTFNTTPEHIQEIINVIQSIEPGGIGSSSLNEALLCQLKLQGFDENSLEYKIIANYYDLLLKRKYSKIAKALGVAESDLSQAIVNLANLETRPARRYLHTPPQYINPDFSIEWQNDNLVAVINDETIPVLRIAPKYREIISSPKNFTQAEVDFARSKVQSALNLIKAIESRRLLLKRIIDYIIANQREFFIHGKEFIKPIPIRTAAEALGVHISTISRACQGKYVETPVGIFPLKYFFATGIGDHSRHSLKEKIQNIINQEDKTRPYTDDEIVEILAQQNIKISRRTVAKYREELNIPGSTDRSQK